MMIANSGWVYMTRLIMDKKYIYKQIDLLREAIDNGTISRDSPLIREQIDEIIDREFENEVSKENNRTADKVLIGAIIDKMFADELELVL